SYADVESGEPLLVVGSAGTLEVSVRDGSAAERFGVRRGASVEVTSAA
ncbi:MAG: SAM hydroxide adenosyltransferase, partial [Gemmatimonadota bacterium]